MNDKERACANALLRSHGDLNLAVGELNTANTVAERLIASRPFQTAFRRQRGSKRLPRYRRSGSCTGPRYKHYLRMCHVNVEGFSRAKGEIIAKIATDGKVSILALQETHLTDMNEWKLKIPGFTIVNSKGHDKFGLAILVKNEMAKEVTENLPEHEFAIGIKFRTTSIYNVYKPPSQNWDLTVLPHAEHPAVFMGDFNSHHQRWGYGSNNDDGVRLADWAELNNYQLVFDAKDKPTFRSRTWGTATTPDICFVSRGESGMPLSAHRKVLQRLPKSQHCMVTIEIGLRIPIIHCPALTRWNLRKANWSRFTAYVERNIQRIPATPLNYDRFTGLLSTAAQKSIPRGARKEYTPCWTKECSELLHNFNEHGDNQTEDKLISLLDEERKKRWHETVENLNFTHSSRESWSLLKKLGETHLRSRKPTRISPDQISMKILETSKIKVTKEQKKKLRGNMDLSQAECVEEPTLVGRVTENEVLNALQHTKSAKAAGVDEILPEFLKNMGEKGVTWLAKLFTSIITLGQIPKKWKESKIIAIQKQGKSGENPGDYRPISLLCVAYKIFERVLLGRLDPLLEGMLPATQAGFRKGRSCCEQVLALTTYIEQGFQKKKKTGVVFLDLTSAYDTVWINGLLLKVARMTKCKKMVSVVESMLRERKYTVYLDGKASKTRVLNNGLPQGSVLAPALFNLYIADTPSLGAHCFAYADDLAIATQSHSFEELEETLNKDLKLLQCYYQDWHLTVNPTKTISSVMHLNNREARRELKLTMKGEPITHSKTPKYLGVKLDRTLTFKSHIEDLCQKLKTRNNLLMKLAGTTWGSKARTLRTSSLALVYSAAEYCAPVWMRSVHARKVDVQLNETMRLITGTLRPTPTPWLPVLANIEPSDHRRLKTAQKMSQIISNNPSLPIHQYIPQSRRLKSRNPFQLKASLPDPNIWRTEWQLKKITNHNLVPDPTQEMPGFELPRRLWTAVNRIRVGVGRCRQEMVKWGMADDPRCECGEIQDMGHILKCSLHGFKNGDITDFHKLTDEALEWVKNTKICL